MGVTLNDNTDTEAFKEELDAMAASPRAKSGWAVTLHMTKQVQTSILCILQHESHKSLNFTVSDGLWRRQCIQ